jgi:hypothetical protein
LTTVNLVVPTSTGTGYALGSVNRRLRRLIVATVIASLSIPGSACIGYSTTGTITGHLIAVGGPNGQKRPLEGTVYVSGAADYQVDVPKAAVGGFSVTVEQGTYEVRGRSPGYQDGNVDCLPRESTVTVRADEGLLLDVVCQEK